MIDIEKKDDRVVVELEEDRRLRYRLDEFGEEKSLLTSEGVKKVEEWKYDLVENHGVDLDELQR